MFSPKLYISSGHLNVDPDNLSSCILRAKALGFDGLEILGPAITGGSLSDPEAKKELSLLANQQNM